MEFITNTTKDYLSQSERTFVCTVHFKQNQFKDITKKVTQLYLFNALDIYNTLL